MPENFKMSDGKPGGNVAGGPNLEGVILRVDNYQDGKGRMVQHRVITVGEAPEGFVPFIGVAQCKITIQTPQGPQEKIETFRFPIDGAKTIEDAYVAFEGFQNRHAKQYEERVQKALNEANAPKLAMASPRDMAALRPPTSVRGG